MVGKSLALLLVLAAAWPASDVFAGERLSLQIAKTQQRVVAFGAVSPKSPDRRVAVRLFSHSSATGDELLERARVRPTETGSYEVRFPRPADGTCKVVSRYRSGGAVLREEEIFPCYIPDFGNGAATLTSLEGRIEIDVLIADDDIERRHGLMYRRRLRTDLGMAFLWDEDVSSGFWMKETLVPLSIAFFDANGVILRILDMRPCDDGPCPVYDPNVTYRGALEVKRGAFDEWGITEGDHIQVTETP